MPTRFGALAQLGERYNGIVEVRSSILLGSTKPPLKLRPKSTAVLRVLSAYLRQSVAQFIGRLRHRSTRLLQAVPPQTFLRTGNRQRAVKLS